MDFSGINFSEFAMAAFVIVGLVNGLNMALARDWQSFARFMLAVIAGVVFGLIHWFGLPSPEMGLAVAIGSSGAYKLAQKVGGE